MMRSLPTLGPRGEGWVVIQGVILVAIFIAGGLGPAWGGGLRVSTGAVGILLIATGGLMAVRGLLDGAAAM